MTCVVRPAGRTLVYEASIWLSVLFERRWAALRPALDAQM
jgi:hypothetical protein